MDGGVLALTTLSKQWQPIINNNNSSTWTNEQRTNKQLRRFVNKISHIRAPFNSGPLGGCTYDGERMSTQYFKRFSENSLIDYYGELASNNYRIYATMNSPDLFVCVSMVHVGGWVWRSQPPGWTLDTNILKMSMNEERSVGERIEWIYDDFIGIYDAKAWNERKMMQSTFTWLMCQFELRLRTRFIHFAFDSCRWSEGVRSNANGIRTY